jgi:hypothetical protein
VGVGCWSWWVSACVIECLCLIQLLLVSVGLGCSGRGVIECLWHVCVYHMSLYPMCVNHVCLYHVSVSLLNQFFF